MRVRTAVLLTSIVVLPSTMLAQKSSVAATTWGPWAALNMTTIDGDDAGDVGNRTAFGLGVSLQHSLGNAAFFGTGLHYAMRGSKEDDATLKLNYIELPLLIGYRFPTAGAVRPYVMGGGHVAFKAGCNLAGESGGVSASMSCEDAGLEVKSTDFAAIGGAGLNFLVGANTFSVDLRYAMGLQDIAEDASIKNRGFTLGLGYMFPLGR